MENKDMGNQYIINKVRLSWLDILKGIGIILVAVGHMMNVRCW